MKARFLFLVLAIFLAAPPSRAATKFTDLPAASSVDEADIFPFVDISATADKKVTLANLRLSLIPNGSIANAKLANSTITVGAGTTSLGGSVSLDGMSGLSTTGFIKRTGANTWGIDATAYEPALGVPGVDGYVLSSTTGGTRTWVPGGGIAQVPAWTYTADPVATGLFTTDDATLGATTAITLSKSVLGGYAAQWSSLPKVRVIFTNSSGVSAVFATTGLSADGSDNIVLAGSMLAGSGSWDGSYKVTFAPASRADLGLATTDAPTFANITLTHSTLTYASTTDIDFAGNGYQTETLTGNVTFTTSNLTAGRSKTIRIIGDSTERNLAFPGWVFVGAAAPSTIAGGKTAILTITSFGTTDGACVAAYAVEP